MAYDRRQHGIKDPIEHIKKFKDLEDFRNNWCKKAILIELIHSKLTFEEANLFEHCQVIQEEIDDYTDRMVEGLTGNITEEGEIFTCKVCWQEFTSNEQLYDHYDKEHNK